MLIIRTLFNIIILKSKPDDLPFNINYTIAALIAACLATALSTSLHPLIDQTVPFAIIKVITTAGLVSLFLVAAQKSARITQTLLALLGTAALLQLSIYLSSLINLRIFTSTLSIWAFILQTAIIKYSLDTGKIQAFFISLSIEMSSLFILFLVFPDLMQNMITTIEHIQTSNRIIK